ncbi:MAG TPA: hypothetical protein PLI74_08435 [Candidatus Kapabacteria bacterium]|nr:hypothetical protein [Candidatus Kapabacteria bacterium]
MNTLANSQDIDALWDYMDPIKSEQCFTQAIAQINPGTLPLLYAELLTQRARAIGLQQQYERAFATLADADALINNTSSVALVRYYLEYGRLLHSSRTSHANEYLLKSYTLAIELHEDFYAIDAAHMLGIIEKGLQSLEWNTIAIDIAEKSIHPRAKKWLGSLYNNTAWTYFFSENYQKAYTIFQKSKAWYAERNLLNEEFIAEWSLARTLRAQGHLQEALQAQLTLLENRQAANFPEDGYISEELGEILLSMGREQEATPHFAHAFDLLRHDIWLQQNEDKRLKRLELLSNNFSNSQEQEHE